MCQYYCMVIRFNYNLPIFYDHNFFKISIISQSRNIATFEKLLSVQV